MLILEVHNNKHVIAKCDLYVHEVPAPKISFFSLFFSKTFSGNAEQEKGRLNFKNLPKTRNNNICKVA